MPPQPNEEDAAFVARLAGVAGAVERVLETFLADAPRPGEIARPPRLMAAMRHAALAGGKRLRPFLVVETARLLGRDDPGVVQAGAAVELLHCYSLVHDDLPAMDDDDLRRGKPTVHRAFDEATAILAGDALQALAFERLADPAVHPDPAVRSELVLGLARAGGLAGMAGGQMLDLAAEGRYGDAAPGEAEIRRLQAMKTGALLAFAVEAGAILAGADAAARKALRAYGQALGAAFQIADDLLDRRGERRCDRQAHRQGCRERQGDARRRARHRAGAGSNASASSARRFDALERFGAGAEVLRQAARFTAARRT